jgi:hypothetical protein
MPKYGQVIEIYPYGEQTWVTVWDLEAHEQRAACDSTSKLDIRDFVTFACEDDTFLTDVKKIEAHELPSGLTALI